MARKPSREPEPSLFGEAQMAPVAKPVVDMPMAPATPRKSIMGAPPVAPSVPVTPPPAATEADDVRERPKLRIVDPLPDIPEEDVIVESNGDGRFVVSLLRHYGTTCASVIYTRKQLEMLGRRIPPALEVG